MARDCPNTRGCERRFMKQQQDPLFSLIWKRRCYQHEIRIKQLEALLRESLSKNGCRSWHERVHAALGEPMPPVRILKGKIPRYQQKQIEAGVLNVDR